MLAGPLFPGQNGYAGQVEIRAVLFDLDNTLFDHRASSHAAVRAFLGHFALDRSEELTRAWFDIENRVFDGFLAKRLDCVP